MKAFAFLLLACSLTALRLSAQSEKAQFYNVRVLTQTGEQYRGMLYEVTDSLLYLRESPNELGEPYGSVIPLDEVKKVVLRRDVKRAPVLQGALIGAFGVGFLTFRSLQRHPLRSPVLTGLTFVTATGTGAGLGAVVGSLIGRSPRRVVRVRQGELDSGRLSGLLRPFAYRNQLDRVYGVP